MKIPNIGNWTFESNEVGNCFEEHVREQLPWYDLATRMTAFIACCYVSEGGTVLDIGAGTGNIARAIRQIVETRKIRIVSYESSKDMASRFEAPGELITEDIRSAEFPPCDVAVSFLTLIFLPPKDRREVIRRIHDRVNYGGALVVVERSTTFSGYLGTVSARLTLAEKRYSGAKPDEIIQKELSLVGVQRPISVLELPGNPVEIFRFGDFVGWVIEVNK